MWLAKALIIDIVAVTIASLFTIPCPIITERALLTNRCTMATAADLGFRFVFLVLADAFIIGPMAVAVAPNLSNPLKVICKGAKSTRESTVSATAHSDRL